MRSFARIAVLRINLLFRQKLGWAAAAAGLAAVVLSMVFARVSFVNFQRIYWDFALGSSFLLQAVLGLYLGSQIFHEERNRRTLHLLLASGVSRSAWLAGNVAGVWLALAALNLLLFVVSLGLSYVCFGVAPVLIALQAQWALAAEMWMVLWGALLLSLLVRPALSFLGSAALFFFLHSTGSIERILSERQSALYGDTEGVKGVLWIAKALPPLDWYDLRVFVGYKESVGAGAMLGLVALAFAWGLLLAALSTFRFERMDL